MAEKTPQRPGGLKPAANRLAGKVCVVFGGTGNVGAGVAQAFAAEGAAKVVVTSRSQAKLDATRAQWGWPASVVGVVGSFETTRKPRLLSKASGRKQAAP